MRLKEEKIDNIAKKIVNDFKSNPHLRFLSTEDNIHAEIKHIFIKDLKREDDLDEEIHKKLKENLGKIQKENMNYTELFKKAKNKLAKDKRIIL
jgi:hypothetical protein